MLRPVVLALALASTAFAQADLSGNHRLTGRPFWSSQEVPVELLLQKVEGGYEVTHTWVAGNDRVTLTGRVELKGGALVGELGQPSGLRGRLGAGLAESDEGVPSAFKGSWSFAPDGAITGVVSWTFPSGAAGESSERGQQAAAKAKIASLVPPLAALDANPNPGPQPGPVAHLLSDEDWAGSLPDRAAFEAFSRRDNVPGAMGVREVKFLITGVGTANPRLHLINTTKFEFHFDFAKRSLLVPDTLNQFNAKTYFTNSRQNLAGSLIAHDRYQPAQGTQGIYTLEFWPTDPVRHDHVAMAFHKIQAALPFAPGKLYYHPSSETQRRLYRENRQEFVNRNVRVIATEDLFRDVAYSPLNLGVGFGLLRVMDAAGGRPPTARDVVIFRALPNDLTHVAGCITEVPQTPLSHVNLKAKQNDTPNAFVKGASTHARLAPLVGKLVRFEVLPDDFSIREATQAEVDEHLEKLRPATAQFPPRDLSVTEPVRLRDIGHANVESVGAKAANVAELRKILPAGVSPDGMAVPFSLYHRFMEANGLYAAARTMIAAPDFQSDPAVRERRLAEFRERIEDAPVPADVRQKLDAARALLPANTPVRCRSSTNNEDLPGFNGAGLYDSFTHRLDEGRLENTVKQVWASLWNYRAFEEREFYRVDHFTTAMGVLLHPNYDDELANGVAVTKNIYDPNWVGYYVNVQVGESLVTNPDEAATPEEYLIARTGQNGQWETQFIQRTSLPLPQGQTSVMTPAQMSELRRRMTRIQEHFKVVYGAQNDPEFAMDIEFKVDGQGRVVIKQARPWVD